MLSSLVTHINFKRWCGTFLQHQPSWLWPDLVSGVASCLTSWSLPVWQFNHCFLRDPLRNPYLQLSMVGARLEGTALGRIEYAWSVCFSGRCNSYGVTALLFSIFWAISIVDLKSERFVLFRGVQLKGGHNVSVAGEVLVHRGWGCRYSFNRAVVRYPRCILPGWFLLTVWHQSLWKSSDFGAESACFLSWGGLLIFLSVVRVYHPVNLTNRDYEVE